MAAAVRPVSVADRRRDRPDADREQLVGLRPPALADLGQDVVELGTREDHARDDGRRATGWRAWRRARAAARSASRTWPIDVASAGKRVPMWTDDGDDLRPPARGPCTRCRSRRAATSSSTHRSCRPAPACAGGRRPRSPGRRCTAVPSSQRLRRQRVRAARRSARTRAARASSAGAARSAAARPVLVATSLTVSSIDVGPNDLMTSRPRASASTKSPLPLRSVGRVLLGVHPHVSDPHRK